ncbi:hypothetical protein pb186bvf_003434 [Paramecium bursaria]
MKFVLFLVGAALAFNMMSLDELSKTDLSQFDCSQQTKLLQIQHQLLQWEELLGHKSYIKHDLKLLRGALKMLEGKQSFLELNSSLHSRIVKKLKALKLPHTKSKIGSQQLKTLLQKCNDVDTEVGREELCKLLRDYIANLKGCQQQCRSAPVTVIKIKGQIKDIQVFTAGCNSGAHKVTVNTDDKTVHVQNGQVTEVQNQ